MPARRDTPRVSILIVTYNSAKVIGACLHSLGDDPRHEVIVIDNDSTDDTLALIESDFPWVRLIENSENAGFGRAVNKAASSASGSDLMLLNPDALVTSADVRQLWTILSQDSSIAAVAPLVESEGNDLRVISAGHAPTIWRMFLHETGLSRLGYRCRRLEGHYLFRSSFDRGPRDVDWTSGGCVMVRASVWRSEGGLSDRWFMYAEDVELCLRIRSSGLRIVVDPSVHAVHAVGGSSDGVDGRVGTAWIVNLFDLYSWRGASSPVHALCWKAVVAAGFGVRWVVFGALGLLRTSHSGRARRERQRYAIYLRALLLARSAPVRDRLLIPRQTKRRAT